ncbi:hypothetical protein RclHR1_08120005 [Rhizophagus clarus]|uniref:Uncharacterized protein n=1 Tax=Rhizophagus clarus TaxID=94130 RepID=A0A2Z6RZZ9_9GLOM|nr:hypothetical protein RclHR1_08120005 [Rhizophagus clarus]
MESLTRKWLVLLIGGNDIVEGKQRVFIVEPINNIDYPELNVKQISQHNGTIFIIKSCPFLPRFCRKFQKAFIFQSHFNFIVTFFLYSIQKL